MRRTVLILAGAATLARVKAALTSDARRSALMSTDALGGN